MGSWYSFSLYFDIVLIVFISWSVRNSGFKLFKPLLCADPEWGQRVRTPFPENHNFKGFLGNTSPDLMENHKATKLEFNDRPSSAHSLLPLKNAVRVALDPLSDKTFMEPNKRIKSLLMDFGGHFGNLRPYWKISGVSLDVLYYFFFTEGRTNLSSRGGQYQYF